MLHAPIGALCYWSTLSTATGNITPMAMAATLTVIPMLHLRFYFVAQLYRATKWPCATSSVATAANRINKHGF